MNSILCPYENHLQQKLYAICFNKSCKQQRLCCVKCIDEFHQFHPKNIIQIDQLYQHIQQESNREAKYPWTYTYGQCQVIQSLEDFLNQIDGLQKIIIDEIERLKLQNLQNYLKEQDNYQQDIEYWNKQIEGLLQYLEVKDYLLTNMNQERGKLSKIQGKQIKLIKQAKESLQQIIKQFVKNNSKYLQFEPDSTKLVGHQNHIWGVVISQDGAIIASGSSDKTVRLWDQMTKQLLQTFQSSGEVYGGVAISSDNKYLAYGGDGDYSIQLHDLQKNKNYGILKGCTKTIFSIVFSSDSHFLYSGGRNNQLIIWNLSQKTQINKFETDSLIWEIVVSPDNKLISCICSNSINIWDFQNKAQVINKKFPHSYGGGLCCTKDSQIFISSGDDGIKIWRLKDVDKNKKSLILIRTIMDTSNSIFRVILTSDEKYLISICNKELQIMIHQMESGILIQELQYGIGQQLSNWGYISISNDMNIIVCGGQDKMVKCWTRKEI